MAKSRKTKKKTKRKLAHPKLPMQGQLNFSGGDAFRPAPDVRQLEQEILSGPPSWLQSDVGSPAKASPQGIFHLWHNSGAGPRYSNQSGAGPAIRAGLVSSVRALSRDAALGGSRRSTLTRSPAGSHGGI